MQSVNLGSGFFAQAQREILEVLLNKPELFEIVKPKISAEVFEVPILKQVATILFEALAQKPDVHLTDILAAAESVEQGSVIVDLAQTGEEKGNFQSRLDGALDAVRRYQAQKRKSRIKATKDQTRFLRCVSENTEKENPHSVGMV